MKRTIQAFVIGLIVLFGATANAQAIKTKGLINTGHLVESGVIRPTATTGTVNNYAPTGFADARVIYQDQSGATTFSGLAGGVNGRVVTFFNNSATGLTMTFSHESGSSTDINRFNMPGGGSIQLTSAGTLGSVANFAYDGTLARWRLTGYVSSSSGLSINTASLASSGSFFLSGNISPTAITTVGSPYNDYAPTSGSTAASIRQDVTTPAVVTGLSVSQANGRIVIIHNIATSTVNTLTLRHDDLSASSATNRFYFANGQDLVLPPNGSIMLRWDSARWRPTGSVTGVNAGSLTESGFISATAVTGTIADYTPAGFENARTVLQDVSGSTTISGIKCRTAATPTGDCAVNDNGRVVTIINTSVTGIGLAFSHQGSGSSAANRFINFNGSSTTLTGGALPGSSVSYIYDGSALRWRQLHYTSTTIPSATIAAFAATGASSFSGTLAPAAMTTVGGPYIDYAPGSSAMAIRQDVTTPAVLTGLSVGQGSGRIVVIHNIATATANTLTLSNDATSTVANRFLFEVGADLVIPAGGSVALRYDGTSFRWRPIHPTPGVTSGAVIDGGFISPTATTGTMDNYTPTGFETARFVRQDTSGTTTFTGLKCRTAATPTGDCAASDNGRTITIYDIGTNSLVFTSEGSGSAAANRFQFPGAVSHTLTGSGGTSKQSITFVYDGASLRWIPLSTMSSTNSQTTFNATSTFTGNETHSGNVALNGQVTLNGLSNPTALTTAGSPYADWAPTGFATTNSMRVDVTTPATITGIASPANGKTIYLHNIATSSANTITLVHDDGASSTAANRFNFCNNANVVIAAGSTVTLHYVGTTGRWKLAQGCADSTALTQPGVLSPAQLVSSENNYAPTGAASASTMLIDLSASWTITGLAGGWNGRMVTLVNASTAFNLVMSHESGSSTTTNRFTNTANTTATVTPGGYMTFIYDAVSSRWRQVGLYTASTGHSQTFSSTLAASATLLFTGSNNPTALSGTNNDWSPTSVYQQRIAITSAAIVTGYASGVSAGRTNRLVNIETDPAKTLTLTHEDSGSTAANRFLNPNGASIIIGAGGSAFMQYDGTSLRWRVTCGSGCTSGVTVIPGASITTTDTGTQADYNPAGLASASILRLNPALPLTINGIAGGQDGRILWVCNISTTSGADVTITHESGTAANRVLGTAYPGNSTMQSHILRWATTNTNSCLQLMYDSASLRWRTVSLGVSSYNALYAGALAAGTITASSTLTAASRVATTGTDPAISACGGGTPTILGSDFAGRVVTGTANTGCVLTFSSAFSPNIPSCVCSDEHADAAFKCVPALGTLTVTFTANSGNAFSYHCINI